MIFLGEARGASRLEQSLPLQLLGGSNLSRLGWDECDG